MAFTLMKTLLNGELLVKKNILQFIHSFHQGGSERQAIQLTKLLHETETYNVFLATLDSEGILREEIEKIGLADIREFRLTSFYDLNFVKQLRTCVDFIRQNKIELVHTHEFYTNIFGMLAAFLANVPIRIASRRETVGIRSSVQKKIERSAYRLAHAIVANAEAVREQLIREGVNAGKIEVIYNGLDNARVMHQPTVVNDKLRKHTLDQFGLPHEHGQRFVTIVANFRLEVKDHPTFLRAASHINKAIANTAFVLVGEGSLTEQMKTLGVQLGLEKTAFFIGQCDSVAELLAISDVCVLSSKAEGFSNSILEYMAAQRPVVVTDVGGAREVVKDGETGYLVPPGDDEAMAAHIITLLNNPEQANQMGQRGRQIVEKKFSCSAQLQNTQNLYYQLFAANNQSIRIK